MGERGALQLRAPQNERVRVVVVAAHEEEVEEQRKDSHHSLYPAG